MAENDPALAAASHKLEKSLLKYMVIKMFKTQQLAHKVFAADLTKHAWTSQPQAYIRLSQLP